MSNVVVVEAKGEKAAILVMDDGTRVWTPEKAKADELVGKPIPGDWTRKDGDYGPQAFPPRPKGGGGGGGRPPRWTDSEEGARWADSRIDRRRALELAVDLAKVGYGNNVTVQQLATSLCEFLATTDVRPASKPTPAQTHSGGGSPAGSKANPPPASGAPRPSGGGGPAQEGKTAPQPPSPTGPKKYDADAWAGMPDFDTGGTSE